MAPSYMSQSELERRNWPCKLEYHISLFSQALGLCSFWRFPYLALENGGAPFMYAFLLLYCLVGIPVVFIEMAWGQYSNLAPPQGFSTIPIMQGVGWSMLLVALMVVFYHGAAAYYLLLYTVSSMSNPLPFASCNNTWNSELCQFQPDPDCIFSDVEGFTRKNDAYGIETTDGFIPKRFCDYTYNGSHPTPSIEFWTRNLAVNGDICRNIQNVPAILTGASSPFMMPAIAIGVFLFVRLLVSFFSLLQEVRFTGKIAYGLCTVPFAVLVMVLVRCLTLPNAVEGVKYLFIPRDLTSFLAPKLWKDAMSQVFLSLMVTWGGLYTWASYNRFYNKYEVDASMLLVTVPLLSCLPTVSVFGVQGYISYATNVSISSAFDGVTGPIAPFVAYSEAVSQMWGDPVPWSIIVFVTFFALSTSAILPAIECMLSSVSDSLSSCRATGLRVVSSLLVLLFTLTVYMGVPCIVQEGALRYFTFFDTITFPVCCMLIAVPELLMITYAFGVTLLRTNIKAMTNNTCLKRMIWPVFWGGITPSIIMACLCYTLYGVGKNGLQSLTTRSESDVSAEEILSDWTSIASFAVIGVVFLTIVVTMMWKVARASGSCAERLGDASAPIALGRSSVHTNGSGRGGRSNGDLYMADYVGHRDANEILVEDDIVTTV